MDIVHIEARYSEEINLPEEFMNKLPKSIVLFTTVQYMNSLDSMKKQLSDKGIQVHLIKPRHTCYEGQILGCSTQNIEIESDYVYIGDGLFHPKALLIRNNSKVFTYNPKTGDESIIDKEATKSMIKKLTGLYTRFLSAKRVAVLITLKPGQMKPHIAKGLEERYPNKKFYYLADHTYNFSSLADFKGIDLFLNTMCERIGLDDMDVQGVPIFNVEDLNDIEKGVFD